MYHLRQKTISAISATIFLTAFFWSLPLFAQAVPEGSGGNQEESDSGQTAEMEEPALPGEPEPLVHDTPAETPEPSVRVGDKFSMSGNVTIQADEIAGDIVAIDGDVLVIGRVEGDIIAISGDVTVEPSGYVTSDIAAIGGDIMVEGRVLGDISVFGGNLRVDPEGTVSGDADIFGGGLTGSIGGKLKENPSVDFPFRPVISGPRAVLFMLIAALIVHLCWSLVFPGATTRLAGVLDHSPGPVVGVGFLVMLVIPSLLIFSVIVLAATVVGIPLAVLLIISPFFVFTLGWAGLSCWIGSKVLRLAKVSSPGPQISVIIGTIIIHVPLLLPLPLLNGLLFLIGTVLVHGMLTLTRLGVRYDWDLPVYSTPSARTRTLVQSPQEDPPGA
jgi:hypothetical protein